MPRDPLQPERCAQLLAALAAPERLRIVRLLVHGSRNVSEIIELAEIPGLNVSHHLNVLKQARIICGKKRGRFVYYSLRSRVLADVVEAGIPKQCLDLGCCSLLIPSECRSAPE